MRSSLSFEETEESQLAIGDGKLKKLHENRVVLLRLIDIVCFEKIREIIQCKDEI
jgi:hypothetical protein